MLPLLDSRWNTYIGGYQVPYDASQALRRLLDGPDQESALAELENELCHQGDLGSASYAALPWIVEYVRRCPELDARAVGLALTIEFGRPFNRGELPEELREGYETAVRQLPEVVVSKRGRGPWDDRQVQVAASVLALGQGNLWFARTYYELDRAELNHMIQQEFGSADWDWP
jgi:hypothetical protein